jgi:hypothetical protein
MPWKRPATQRQRFEAFHLGKSLGYGTTMIHNRTIGRLAWQICIRHNRNHISNWVSMEHSRSINGVSTIFALASWIIQSEWNAHKPQWTYWQPLLGKLQVMISRLPPTIECPRCVNCFCRCSKRYTAINCIVLFLNGVLRGQSLQSVLVFNFINMHGMSYWWNYFPSSCSQYLRTCSLLYCIITSGSLSSWITQIPYFYRHMGYKIFEYLLA